MPRGTLRPPWSSAGEGASLQRPRRQRASSRRRHEGLACLTSSTPPSAPAAGPKAPRAAACARIACENPSLGPLLGKRALCLRAACAELARGLRQIVGLMAPGFPRARPGRQLGSALLLRSTARSRALLDPAPQEFLPRTLPRSRRPCRRQWGCQVHLKLLPSTSTSAPARARTASDSPARQTAL